MENENIEVTVEEQVTEEKKEKKKHKNKYEDKIKELELALESEKDKFLRYRAETENFKRRIKDEADRNRKYSSQTLISSIIPALDNLDRALNVNEPSDELKNFLVGFEMIKNQLVEALKQEGVEVIESKGLPFDHNYHQAVMQEAVDGVESGIVVEEFQKGYKLHDRIIRPSMVKVSE